MTLVRALAAVILFLHLPIPLYWFVLHPAAHFWSTRRNAAYLTGLLASWLPVTMAEIVFRRALFRRDAPAAWQLALGLLLIALEVRIFWLVRRDLGAARLVGATELSRGGRIEQGGIYARLRHPRYVGSFLALVGACLLAATRALWIVAAAWTLLMRIAIALEEREMRARFGVAFEEYARRVPRFLPRLAAPPRF